MTPFLALVLAGYALFILTLGSVSIGQYVADARATAARRRRGAQQRDEAASQPSRRAA